MEQQTSTDLLRSLSKKMSVLIALMIKREGDSDATENIKFLNEFDLTNEEIAEILSTSKNYVAVIKSKNKK